MFRCLLRAKGERGTKDWSAQADQDALNLAWGTTGASQSPTRVGIQMCENQSPSDELLKRMAQKRREGYWVVETQLTRDSPVIKLGQLYANQLTHISAASAERLLAAIQSASITGVTVTKAANMLWVGSDKDVKTGIPIEPSSPSTTRVSVNVGPDQASFAVILCLAHLINDSELAVETNGTPERVPSIVTFVKSNKTAFSANEIDLFERVGVLPTPVRIGLSDHSPARRVFSNA